jgi:molybdopterin-guanine dinucleotide biosynthesis protein A
VRYDGVVLAGGAGRRLGGISKPAIAIGGRQLLDIAVDALAGADTVVAVGAALATERPVTWTRERPVGGGPVAALCAALELIRAPVVVVLAADLPFVTAPAIDQLVAARGDAVAALAVDADGRDQPLVGCYDVAALRAALPDIATGASMRSVLTRLEAAGRIERRDLGGHPPVTWDCDTTADLIRAQELA